jgi:hypothetical protein
MTNIHELLDEVELQEKQHQRFYLGISGIGNPNQRLVGCVIAGLCQTISSLEFCAC